MAEVSARPFPSLRSAAQIEWIDVDGRTDGGPRALLGSRRRWNVLLKFCGAMEQNEVIYCIVNDYMACLVRF